MAELLRLLDDHAAAEEAAAVEHGRAVLATSPAEADICEGAANGWRILAGHLWSEAAALLQTGRAA